MLKAALLLALAIAAEALPVDPNDDVELIKPVNRNSGSPGSGSTSSSESGTDEPSLSDRIPTILIIRRTHPFFGGIPFFRGAPAPDYSDDDSFFGHKESDDSSSSDPDYDSVFPTALRPTFLGPIFGVRRGSDSNATANSSEGDLGVGVGFGVGSDNDAGPCGFFCAIMRNFQAHIDQIEGEIAAARNNSTTEANEGEVNNSTYTEKVLPDGSVLKINRTVVSNSDKDSGTSFFFHSTLFHNGGGPEDAAKDEAKPEEKAVGDDAANTTPRTSTPPPSTATTATTTPTKPTTSTTPASRDDNENEIVGEKKPEIRPRPRPLLRRRRQSATDGNSQSASNPQSASASASSGPPPTFEGDTRVNDLLLASGHKKVHPDAELIANAAGSSNNAHIFWQPLLWTGIVYSRVP